MVSTHSDQLWPEEQEVSRRLTALARRGQAEGVLRDDLPAEQLATLHGSLIIGALTHEPLLSLGVEEAAATITALYLDGARSRP